MPTYGSWFRYFNVKSNSLGLRSMKSHKRRMKERARTKTRGVGVPCSHNYRRENKESEKEQVKET